MTTVPCTQEVMHDIVSKVERRFAERGATPQGLWWPNADDLARRYGAALGPVCDAFAGRSLSLLDFGCGVGFLPDWMEANGLLDRFSYLGLDASGAILEAARARWPRLAFVQADVLAPGGAPDLAGRHFDVTMACGIFTVRFGNGRAEMEAYVRAALQALWRVTDACLVFNVMSPHVDWERDDLFHWGLDEAAGFAKRHLSRHVDVTASYGLWEYTMHVWRDPRDAGRQRPARWG